MAKPSVSRLEVAHAAKAAVEQALPGLRCNRLRCFGMPSEPELYVVLSVSGSAEDLLRHDLVTPHMIERLPHCGSKRFSGIVEGERNGHLFRTSHGYRLKLWLDGDAAWQLLRTLGLDADRMKAIEIEERAKPSAAARVGRNCAATLLRRLGRDLDGRTALLMGWTGARDFRARNRCVGRYQRCMRWNTVDDVIVIDWAALCAATAARS